MKAPRGTTKVTVLFAQQDPTLCEPWTVACRAPKALQPLTKCKQVRVTGLQVDVQKNKKKVI